MPILLVGVAGVVAGMVIGKGTEDLAAVARWTVIGGGIFVAAKIAKVI